MAKLNFGVLVFPGTNCDKDTYWAVTDVAGQNARYIWHTDSDLSDCDVVIVPGGFSYGDYLRSGAIARFSPVLKAVIAHANAGKPVLGICNGFQILAECNLVKGAFQRNKGIHFLCKQQHLKVADNNSLFTNKYVVNDVIQVPIAHGEGNYFLSPDDLKYTLDNSLIAFQYCDDTGLVNEDTNPNGSVQAIAGVYNKARNVLGMMPHPERSSEADLGSVGGKKVWESIVAWAGK